MKKALSVLLSLLLCFSCVTVVFADEDDFEIRDGVLTDYYGDDDRVVVPDGVTTLGNYCFEDCRMTELVLPDSLEVIEYCALEFCRNLKTVTLPKNVREIGEDAFGNEDSLMSIQVAAGNEYFKSVDGVLYDAQCQTLIRFPEAKSADGFTLPATVTVISNGAFNGCGLTEIDLTNVTSIGEYAFGQCSSLRSVTLGTGLTSVGASAFAGSALEEVYYAGSSLQWGEIDIESYGNARLTDAQICFAGGDYRDFDIDDDGVLHGYDGDADKLVVPDFVKVLGEGCLNGKSMSELVLPEGLEVIEDWAISGCENLTTVTIPKSVKEIGIYVFDFDSSLKSIQVAPGSPYFKSADGVLFDKAGTLILKFPEGKTTAGYRLPDTVKTIGSGAFYATDLTGFTVGDNVETIKCWAFSDCPKLTELTLGNGLKTLGDHVFAGSTGLTELTLPASLEEISTFTFDNVRGLTSINAAEGGKRFASVDGILYSSDMRTLVKHPEGRSAADYTLPDTVTKLGPGALTRSDFTEIDLTNVTYIDDYALNECKQLKTVYLGAGLARIGYGAFVHDDALQTVWYAGNSDTWKAIAIDGDNTELTNADLYCTGDGDVPPPSRPGIIGEPWKPEDLPPAGNIIYSDDWGDDLPFTLDDNGTLTISGSGATYGYVTVEFQTGWWSPGMPLPTWSPLHYYKDEIKRVVLTNGLTVLGPNVFYQCSRITDVYFDGTEEEWNAIDIREGNETLTGATIHFKYVEPPHEHDWGEPAYVWSGDNGSVTATRVCRGDESHTETETVDTASAVTAATCTENGKTTYTAVFENPAFAEQTKEIAIPAAGHDWGEPTYTWSKDNAAVTATRVCKTDKTHAETETVKTKTAVAPPACEQEGKTTYTATFTNPVFTKQTKEVAIPAAGHDWGEPTYTWSKDNAAVTATRVCKTDKTHAETETVKTKAAVVPPACAQEGKTTYTATFTNPVFTKQTKEVAIPAAGHDWGEPTYTWSKDNSSVTATRVCKTDKTHAETETVKTKAAVVPATCTENGKTTYTATFTNPVFTKQTKEVAIPAAGHDWGEPTYTWSKDNATVTATRVCKTDKTHAETETVKTKAAVVPATCTEDGKTTYTATFTNPVFTKQTKEVAIPAAGHDWGEPTYTWSKDNATVTATRVCKTDKTHAETETVNATAATEAEHMIYTAAFANPAFAEQTKEVSVDIPALPGDVDADGKVSSADARLALRASVGLETYEKGSAAFAAADVTGDGAIKAEDARYILRASVNLEDLSLLKKTA